MKYLLDTNICIYWFKGNQNLYKKIQNLNINSIYISDITLAELLFGAYNSQYIEQNLQKIHIFEQVIPLLHLNRQIIDYYAQIKALLKKAGKMIDDFDILIASIAYINDCILITNNEKHFFHIPNLKIENWIN